MNRSARSLTLVLVPVIAALAACAGPQSLSQDPYDAMVAPAAVSSKISWSPGSAVLNGRMTGLAGANVALDGNASGYYAAVCVNTRSNLDNPQYNEAPGLRGIAFTGSESADFRVRRGAVTFGEGGETFIIEDPALGEDFEPLGSSGFYFSTTGADLGHTCPGRNWWPAIDASRFFITDIDLTLSDLKGKDPTIRYDWTCDPDLVTATDLGCTQLE